MHPVIMEKIWDMILSFYLEKAHGPYGFMSYLYIKCWHIIKFIWIRMIEYVHWSSQMGRGINSTLLALIPKEVSTSSFATFSPIYFCNFSSKIISKIITIFLIPLLPKLISENQGGSFGRRQFVDNIILMQETINYCTNKDKSAWY